MISTQATIITIGDELLIGQVIDTNSAFIAQELNKLGVSLKNRIAVGDKREDIIQALETAAKSTDIIILTGGLGADFLRNLGFSARIEKLVRSHVSAKRYLCYRDPTYLANLSEASRTTLGFQGGIMSAIEAATFERDPDFEKCLLMRNFDEQAKIPNLNVPKLASYSAVLDQLAVPRCEGYQLSPAQLNFWKRNGYLKISNLLDFEQVMPIDNDICTDSSIYSHWS